MRPVILAIAASLALPALAQGQRGLSAHEHGHGQLGIAIEGDAVVMELDVPGADIVGFEHPAESAEDRAAIEQAVTQLASPLALFVLPEAGNCSVTAANVTLLGDDHGEHGDHEHEDHAEEHGDHDHEEHADADHDDHAHEGHEDEHAEHDHDEEEVGGHTEFRAEYALTCGAPEELTQIDFAYFETFPNAQRLTVQLVSGVAAKAFEVGRDAPVLALDGAM